MLWLAIIVDTVSFHKPLSRLIALQTMMIRHPLRQSDFLFGRSHFNRYLLIRSNHINLIEETILPLIVVVLFSLVLHYACFLPFLPIPPLVIVIQISTSISAQVNKCFLIFAFPDGAELELRAFSGSLLVHCAEGKLSITYPLLLLFLLDCIVGFYASHDVVVVVVLPYWQACAACAVCSGIPHEFETSADYLEISDFVMGDCDVFDLFESAVAALVQFFSVMWFHQGVIFGDDKKHRNVRWNQVHILFHFVLAQVITDFIMQRSIHQSKQRLEKEFRHPCTL